MCGIASAARAPSSPSQTYQRVSVKRRPGTESGHAPVRAGTYRTVIVRACERVHVLACRGMARDVRAARWIGCLAAVTIVVVATFPYDFLYSHPHWRRVAWVPFATGIVRPIDLAVNLVMYVPLGYFFPGATWRRAAGLGVPFAVMLSGAMELAQVWSHLRFPTATDVAMNVFGAAVGLWLRWGRHPAQAPAAPLSETASR